MKIIVQNDVTLPQKESHLPKHIIKNYIVHFERKMQII